MYLLEQQLGVACAIPIGVAVGKLHLAAHLRSTANRPSKCHSLDHWV